MGPIRGCILHILIWFMGCQNKLSEMKQRELNTGIKVLMNVLILFLVGIPVILFRSLGSPYQRGFFCDDASLMYPLLPSTVSTSAVIIGGLSIPIIAIIIVEMFKDSPVKQFTEEILTQMCLPKFLKIARALGYFLFGCGCIQTITDLVKYNIGRLRPHFHAACHTNWKSIKANCSNEIHPAYIYNMTCPNPDTHEVFDARLSFFSAHASFSAYTMIYLIIYLERNITWQNPKLLKPFMQFLCLLLAVYTSISRIFDYHHHWSDVLFGFAMGGFMAFLIARYVSGLVRGNRGPGYEHNSAVTVSPCVSTVSPCVSNVP